MFKRNVILFIICLVTVACLGFDTVQADSDHYNETTAKVELTDEQKQEIQALAQDILEKKKEMIAKYVWCSDQRAGRKKDGLD
ncbi:hypothetical protein J2S00_004059 [Caldalkalibacillus uzonensis]|uniref:Uncharacterized protein n=1 Tax=Caldalkalibacillus uzonensis TaxID=353224 RepID=A0ABU0CYH6_9BACI|nr:DUF2680 domain-containing protein [Caldalkalibacillus uzonensis]MDQ0341200.1 hypothetical protein [Caldalkalibacillus uzonensis]